MLGEVDSQLAGELHREAIERARKRLRLLCRRDEVVVELRRACEVALEGAGRRGERGEARKDGHKPNDEAEGKGLCLGRRNPRSAAKIRRMLARFPGTNAMVRHPPTPGRGPASPS